MHRDQEHVFFSVIILHMIASWTAGLAHYSFYGDCLDFSTESSTTRKSLPETQTSHFSAIGMEGWEKGREVLRQPKYRI